MPSQQRFEGPDLEVLLDQVQDRFGGDAHILEANKIRAGGVGGFFARELFEVVVEVAEHVPTGPTESGGRSLLDLVDAVDDGPEPQFYDVEKLGDLASEETVNELLRRTDDQPVDAGSFGADHDRVGDLLDRVDRTRARGTATVPAGPAMSTDGDAFAAVLERIARSTEDRPVNGPSVEAPFRSYAETAPNATTPAARHQPRDDRPTPPVTAPAPRDAVRARRRRPTTSDHDLRAPLDVGALARLGLPTDLVHGAMDGVDRLSALIRLAERFPLATPLPETGDTVIALVGDRAGMQRAVAWVHEQLGLSPHQLVLASRSERGVFPESRRIAGHEDATARRRSWRRSQHPTLVVIDEPVGRRATAWARHVLNALEPSAVWAVVDAQRKPEDVIEWGERIGGIDAIALDGTEETSSPAAILTTGLPVSLIDGHAATPARWAAVLDERLLAA